MGAKRLERVGARHFWHQRATAVALLVLVPLLLVPVVATVGSDQAGVRAVLGNPLVAAGFAVLIAAGVVHMRLGMQVIIEDYVHQPGPRRLLLAANTVFAVIIAFGSLAALLRLALGF